MCACICVCMNVCMLACDSFSYGLHGTMKTVGRRLAPSAYNVTYVTVQTSPRNSCSPITSLAKIPSAHPLQKLYLLLAMPFRPLNPLTFSNCSPSDWPGLLASRYFFLGLQSRPHLSLCCSRSPKRTPNSFPSVCLPQLLRMYFPLLHSTRD